jgi:hypothetical protein
MSTGGGSTDELVAFSTVGIVMGWWAGSLVAPVMVEAETGAACAMSPASMAPSATPTSRAERFFMIVSSVC